MNMRNMLEDNAKTNILCVRGPNVFYLKLDGYCDWSTTLKLLEEGAWAFFLQDLKMQMDKIKEKSVITEHIMTYSITLRRQRIRMFECDICKEHLLLPLDTFYV